MTQELAPTRPQQNLSRTLTWINKGMEEDMEQRHGTKVWNKGMERVYGSCVVTGPVPDLII